MSHIACAPLELTGSEPASNHPLQFPLNRDILDSMQIKMKAERSVRISFNILYDYTGLPKDTFGGGYPHPRDIQKPEGVMQEAWIPQTIGDSVWKLYEFETAKLRDDFITDLPFVYEKARIATCDQDFFDHWLQ